MSARGGYVGVDDLDADLFGEPSESNLNYLRDRVSRHTSRITDHFNGFFDDTREMFERYNGEKALRRIRARVRKVSDIFSRDVVRPLRTIDEIQRAKPNMQRYIMANIMTRIAAQEQRIDGYSDSYRNAHPERHGFADMDFMRVIDGVIFDEDRFGVKVENEHNAWEAHQDLTYNPDERDLDIIEQADILSTWDLLEVLLASKGKDPTSILNEKM